MLLMTTVAMGDIHSEPWPGFTPHEAFGEQIRPIEFEGEARGLVIAPLTDYDASKPTRLVIYATPNGNTVDQTLGAGEAEGRDWHYYIQHVAAQMRHLREVDEGENIVLACIEPEGLLSWPHWRQQRDGGSATIAGIVADISRLIPGDPRVTLACHSGGGSFLFGFLNAAPTIPQFVERIVFLDANYSYSIEDGHGTKLRHWLESDDQRQCIFLAYDDREIVYDGKKVVGPTGGTYRASHRMLDELRSDLEVQEDRLGPFDRFSTLDGRWQTLIHPNRANRILHTRLVGEMNGLLYALTVGTPEQDLWGELGGPPAYEHWIQPEPFETP